MPMLDVETLERVTRDIFAAWRAAEVGVGA